MNQMGSDEGGGGVDRAFEEFDTGGESMLPAAILLVPFHLT